MPTPSPIAVTFALSTRKIVDAIVIVELAAHVSDAKDCHGGYLFVLAATCEAYCSLIGNILDDTKWERHRALAEEKTRRVARPLGHKTSFQSMDEAKGHFQGAIRCPDGTCIGFSGRPSDEDEAICLMYAMCQGLLTDDEAKEIAKISGNTFFGRMLDASD